MGKFSIPKNFASLLLFFFAVLWMLPLLSGSLWMDEAAQALESIRPWSEQLNIPADFQPPLFHIITHFLLQISTAEAWLRGSSVMAGAGSVVLTYLIGKKFVSPFMALSAAVLLATHSLHIFFAQELRPYSIACFWAMLSWYCLLQILEQKKVKKNILLWVGYILSTLAGLYSTYLFPFLFLSQISYVIFTQRKHFPQFLISWICIGLGFLPWLPMFVTQFQTSQLLRLKTQGWDQVVSYTQVKTLPLVLGKFLFGVIDLEVNLFFVGFIMFISSLLVFLFIKNRQKIFSQKKDVYPLLFWFVIPLITAWIVSFWVPIIQPKRVLFLLPPFLLLIVWFIDRAEISFKQKMLILGIFVSLNLFGTFQYWTNVVYQREDWRGLIATIDHTFSPANTAVIFGFDEPFSPWRWYSHQPFSTFTTGTATLTTMEEVQGSLEPILQYQIILVFDYLRDLTDPHRYIEQWLEQYDYTQVGALDRPNIGFVRIYQRGKDANMASATGTLFPNITRDRLQ